MLKLLLGDPNTRKLKRYQPIVEEINFLEEEISQFTDEELRQETHNLKSKISSELDIKYVNKFFGILAFEIWYRIFVTKEMNSNTTLD